MLRLWPMLLEILTKADCLFKNRDMKTLEFIYQETQIHFLMEGDKNVMINATEMAKIFGKRIDFFLKSDHAKAFIKVLLSTPYGGNKNDLSTPYGGNKTNLTIDEILITNKKAGTYMHQILALKFASWLDPEFEVWVYTTIQNIISGRYKIVDTQLHQKALDRIELKELEEQLLLENEKFKKIVELRKSISKTEQSIRNEISNQLDLFMGAKKTR